MGLGAPDRNLLHLCIIITDYLMCKAGEFFFFFTKVIIIHVLKFSIPTRIVTLEQSLLENWSVNFLG